MLINIDVPDLEQGVRFYTQALGLRERRRIDGHIAELAGAECPIFLLVKPAGSVASGEPGATTPTRDYVRHWTPLHLDFVVDDVDAASERAILAGARVERPTSTHRWGRMALLADPFGHGLCLLSFHDRGYDELPWTAPAQAADRRA